MRYLLCAVVALLVACSSAPELTTEAAPVEQSAELATPYRFQFEVQGFNFQSISPPAGTFCHPVAFFGSGANAQAPKLGTPAQVPQYGMQVSGHDTFPYADPNSQQGSSAHTGVAAMSLLCDSYALFGGTLPGAKSDSDSSGMRLSWGISNTLQPVIGSKILKRGTADWTFDSACWIDGFASLSNQAERVQLDASGWSWRLNVEGYKSILGVAQCAFLGRNMGQPVYLQLVKGQDPVWPNITYAEGSCFIHNIRGDLDNGGVVFRHDNPNEAWKFEISGGVEFAEGYCVRF